MTNLLRTPSISQCHHHIWPNQEFEFHADLWWWRSFIETWNGVAVLTHSAQPTKPVSQLMHLAFVAVEPCHEDVDSNLNGKNVIYPSKNSLQDYYPVEVGWRGS